MVSKSYKKNISEGKGLLILAITFAVIMRIADFFFNNGNSGTTEGGCLWTPLAPLFADHLYSLLASTILVAVIAILLAYINGQYTVIRSRTLLPPAIGLLLFSCSPSFFTISSDYVAAIIILYIIKIFLESYNEINKQQAAFRISFFLAIGSLFSPILIIYIPTIWIGLLIIRCFNFKAFLATIFGFFIIYAPALSYFLLTQNIDAFLKPFTNLNLEDLANIPILKYQTTDWIIFGMSILLLIIMFINSYFTSYKDKIRIRAYFRLLGLLISFSLLLFLFLNISTQTNLYITLIIVPFLLSHFLALTHEKWVTYLFYIYILFYFFVIYSFL